MNDNNFENLSLIDKMVMAYNNLNRIETKGENSDLLVESKRMWEIIIQETDQLIASQMSQDKTYSQNTEEPEKDEE